MQLSEEFLDQQPVLFHAIALLIKPSSPEERCPELDRMANYERTHDKHSSTSEGKIRGGHLEYFSNSIPLEATSTSLIMGRHLLH